MDADLEGAEGHEDARHEWGVRHERFYNVRARLTIGALAPSRFGATVARGPQDGYRDALDLGKTATVQEGFDAGAADARLRLGVLLPASTLPGPSVRGRRRLCRGSAGRRGVGLCARGAGQPAGPPAGPGACAAASGASLPSLRINPARRQCTCNRSALFRCRTCTRAWRRRRARPPPWPALLRRSPAAGGAPPAARQQGRATAAVRRRTGCKRKRRSGGGACGLRRGARWSSWGSSCRPGNQGHTWTALRPGQARPTQRALRRQRARSCCLTSVYRHGMLCATVLAPLPSYRRHCPC